MIGAKMVSSVVDETLSSADYPSELCAVLHVPRRSLLNVPHWNNCTCLSFSTALSHVIAIERFKVM